jgi:hypothetical protein
MATTGGSTVARPAAFVLVLAATLWGVVGAAPVSGAPASGWVRDCFQHQGEESGSDRAFVGLDETQALARARSRGKALLLVGANGRCNRMGDQVLYARPVAVAFDGGRIVYATSDLSAQYLAWRLGE